MKEKVITQEMLDRIIKKNSAKYLKKLEEKEIEMEKYKSMLENIENGVAEQQEEKPLGDEDLIETVTNVLNIPEDERSEEDLRLLEENKDAYGHALFVRDMAEAKKWAEENYDGKLEELLKNEDFIDFANGLGGTLPELVKKYVKLTSAQAEKPVEVKTPGSVKDTSGVVAKAYFSKEEVQKMSPEQIKKYITVIENSMKKW